MLPIPVLSGILTAIIVFVIICGFQLTDGVLTRPHRIIWRMIKGSSILYLCFLTFLAFQDINDIRWALGIIDNRIGMPLPEVNYADDCSLAQLSKSVDVFVACHFIGWFVKALIIRDFWLCWFLQIFFEWMEISLRHILPNFWECWWDHLILDVFGCNAFGIWLGMLVVDKLNMKNYTWRVHSQSWKAVAAAAESPVRESNNDPIGPSPLRLDTTSPSFNTKTDLNVNKSIIERFQDGFYVFINPPTPRPKVDPTLISDHVEGASTAPPVATTLWWTTYEWPGLFSSFESFLLLSMLCITTNVLDLNLFFIKAALWIPTNHWINGVRTFWFAAAAAATTREVYEYVSDRSRTRLGSQAFLGFGCVYMETLFAFRIRSGLPPAFPCPLFVKISWAIILVVWISCAVFLFYSRRIKWFPPVEAAKAAGLGADKAIKVVSKVGGDLAVKVERLSMDTSSDDATPKSVVVATVMGTEDKNVPNSTSRKRK